MSAKRLGARDLGGGPGIAPIARSDHAPPRVRSRLVRPSLAPSILSISWICTDSLARSPYTCKESTHLSTGVENPYVIRPWAGRRRFAIPGSNSADHSDPAGCWPSGVAIGECRKRSRNPSRTANPSLLGCLGEGQSPRKWLRCKGFRCPKSSVAWRSIARFAAKVA